jgi:hypothetical protein
MSVFSSPPLVLSIVLASIYSALFHLWQGDGVKELALYWMAGLSGFGLGQLGSSSLGLNVLMVGQIHVLESTLVCWLFLFAVKWLKPSTLRHS